MRRSKVKTRGFWANRQEAARRYSKTKTWDQWSAEMLPQGLRVAVDSASAWRGWCRTIEFEWSEITKVVAYKSDEVTVDTIWLGFESRDGDSVSLPEELPQWIQIATDLPKHLPGCKDLDSWYERVMKPAFEKNYTVLYSGPDREAEQDNGVIADS